MSGALALLCVLLIWLVVITAGVLLVASHV